MHEWIDDLKILRKAGERGVLVTVADVRGSTPREVGAKMLVSKSDTLGTIGGGQIEYQCTQIACELLRGDDKGRSLFRRFPLGANCGQCCGGVVDILFEDCGVETGWFDDLIRVLDGPQEALMMTALDSRVGPNKKIVSADDVQTLAANDSPAGSLLEPAQKAMVEGNACLLKLSAEKSILLEPIVAAGFDIAVFGAGHVGAATVATLAALDCNIRWIDNRHNFFPAKLPANVQAIRSDHPELEVAAMPACSFYLVMTHSHPLDYEICSSVLSRNDFSYCGLIGSLSKQRRFEKRMRRDGLANKDKLTCPIGVSGISGKKPAEIAISVAAEMLRVREAKRSASLSQRDGNVHYLEGQN